MDEGGFGGIDRVPELRIEMRIDPHFGKVPGMGFPDWQNVPRPRRNMLITTRGSLRPCRFFFCRILGFWPGARGLDHDFLVRDGPYGALTLSWDPRCTGSGFQGDSDPDTGYMHETGIRIQEMS